jgi:uncharacterized damage-inducible protein DinB
MTSPAHFVHLASYNQWMNRKLYNAASVLSDEQLAQNQGAFFGSILGTLNHIAVADTLWLKRFASHFPGLTSLSPLQEMPTPTGLDQPLCSSFAELTELRASLDEVIVHLSKELTAQELDAPLEYSRARLPPPQGTQGQLCMLQEHPICRHDRQDVAQARSHPRAQRPIPGHQHTPQRKADRQ